MRQAAASVGASSPFASTAGAPAAALGSLPSFHPTSSSSSSAGSASGLRGGLLRPSRLASQRLPGSQTLTGSQRLRSTPAPAAESDMEEAEPEFKLPRCVLRGRVCVYCLL
jgi:hypothetical protein